jgi:hypothetical protein
MNNLGSGFEKINVGGEVCLLNLKQDTGDPVVGKLKLKDAASMLSDGLANIVKLAKNLEKPAKIPKGAAPTEETNWFLVLDHTDLDAQFQRTNFLTKGRQIKHFKKQVKSVPPLSEIVNKITLDPLTVIGDKSYLDDLNKQMNLPDYVKVQLKNFYK